LKQRAVPAATTDPTGLPDGPYELLVVYDVQDDIDLRNARAGLQRSYAADAAGRLIASRRKGSMSGAPTKKHGVRRLRAFFKINVSIGFTD
jgi:hypothetical protein